MNHESSSVLKYFPSNRKLRITNMARLGQFTIYTCDWSELPKQSCVILDPEELHFCSLLAACSSCLDLPLPTSSAASIH